MGDLCRLFSRTTKLNIGIYVMAILLVTVFGVMWIYGKQQTRPEEEQYWTTRAYIVGVAGLIVIGFFLGVNMIIYEVAFNKKCDALEQYIQRQKTELFQRLNTESLATKVATGAAGTFSRALANKFVDEFKTQFGHALKSQMDPDVLTALKTVMGQPSA